MDCRLAFLGRDMLDARGMRGEIVEAIFQMHALVRRWLFFSRCAGTPFPRRPDRPRGKSAAAIWADIVEFVIGTVSAKCALITADARFH